MIQIGLEHAGLFASLKNGAHPERAQAAARTSNQNVILSSHPLNLIRTTFYLSKRPEMS